MARPEENIEYPWVCGYCGFLIEYIDEEPEVCPECGNIHGQRDAYVLPDEVKFPIS